jgi:hypothetical protein
MITVRSLKKQNVFRRAQKYAATSAVFTVRIPPVALVPVCAHLNCSAFYVTIPPPGNKVPTRFVFRGLRHY